MKKLPCDHVNVSRRGFLAGASALCLGGSLSATMAWGVPVVAWNKAGTTVTVSDGESGFLADPYKVESYAEGILRLLLDHNLRVKMGRAARDRAEALFSWDRHVRILEGAIWQAVGEPVRTEEIIAIIPVVEVTPEPQMAEVEIES